MQRVVPHLAAVVLLSCLWRPAVAVAQPSAITNDIVQASQLDASQRALVQRFAQERLRLFDSGDAERVQSARRDLLEPFHRPNVRPTVGFRLALSDALGAGLTQRVSGKDDFVAANALLVAGALASADALAALNAGVRDARPSVRYAAARGFESLAAAMARGDDALPGEQGEQALATLEQALTAEPDPIVVDGLILAFTAAAGDVADAALRFGALTRMCRGMAAQAQRRRRQGDPEPSLFDRALVRAANAVRAPILRANQLDRGFATQAAIMSGQALALTLHRVQEGAGLPEAERARIDAIARAVQTVLILAHMELTSQNQPELLPREGQIPLDALRRAVSHWDHPSGVLTKPPYNVAPGEFQ